MSPEEKAEELISKYENVDDCDKHWFEHREPCSHQAKQCAVICVEQIIEAAKDFDKKLDEYEGVQMHPEIYWEQVCECLKNL